MKFNILDIFKRDRDKFTVINDPFDVSYFEELLPSCKDLTKLMSTGNSKLPTFDSLTMDIFSILFKSVPMLQEEKKIQKKYRVNRKMIEYLINTPQYNMLREYTVLNEFDSILATEELTRTAIEVLEQMQNNAEGMDGLRNERDSKKQRHNNIMSQLGSRQKPQSQQQDEQQDQPNSSMLGQTQSQQQEEQQHDQSGGGGDMSDQELPQEGNEQQPEEQQELSPEEKEQLEKEAEQIRKELEEIEKQLNEMEEKEKQEVQQRIKSALNRAKNASEEMTEIFTGWGVEDSEAQRMDYKTRLELANKIRSSHKLMQLSKMLGRYKKWAISSNKVKIKQEISELASLCLDNDLSKVIPSELARLGDEDLDPLFIRDYLNGNLICYDLKHKEKEQKGPIIVVVDESGSMSGDKELWSKAVTVAMAELAKSKKRHFAVIEFASERQCRTKQFEYGNIPVLELIDFATNFFSGGTSYYAPLNEALKIINDEKNFKKADILFITDGEAYLDDDFIKKFNEIKEKKEFKMITVAVDFDYCSTSVTSKISDEIIRCSSFAEDVDYVTEAIFQSI